MYIGFTFYFQCYHFITFSSFIYYFFVYQFNESATIKEDHEKYRNNPTDADKMHCVLFVMKAENIDRDVNDRTLKRILEYSKRNSKGQFF